MLKFILIFILVVLLLRLLLRMFLPVVVRQVFTQMQQGRPEPPRRPEGSVFVETNTVKKGKSNRSTDDGDYVDYEEVK